jgi:uncharacterized membrane protein
MSRQEKSTPWYDLRRARSRLQLSLLLGVVAVLAFSSWLPTSIAVIGGWDVAALSLLICAWWIILGSDATSTQERAATEDPGRRVLLLLSTASSLVSFFAAALLMHKAADASREAALSTGICLAAPLLAWLLTHSVYTLHYAHLYYQASQHGAGLDFPGHEAPDDLDFAYFAFTVGMCFQVSDVAVTSSRLRRSVLGHALLSFVFNTAVIAIALNLALGRVF